jgi:hypothetical protein
MDRRCTPRIKKFSGGSDWLGLMTEAKMQCRKVKITYLESPEAEPQTFVVAPYKQIQSVNGWEIEDLPSKEAATRRYLLQNIIEAELTDETYKDPYDDPAFFVAEIMASKH